MSFINAEDTPPENILDELVGEGKKFKSIEDLARSKWEADQHIKRLTGTLDELRTDLSARSQLEDLLRDLQSKNPAPQREPETPSAEAHQPAKPALTDDELAEKVRNLLSQAEQEKTTQQNVREVTETLLKVYGTSEAANAAVERKAAELGVSVEFLQDVAKKSPKALFTTLGVSVENTPPARPTQGDVNPAALKQHSPGGPKPNTYAWFQELRRNNARAYYDPKTQMQMHKLAQENPEAFFNKT